MSMIMLMYLLRTTWLILLKKADVTVARQRRIPTGLPP